MLFCVSKIDLSWKTKKLASWKNYVKKFYHDLMRNDIIYVVIWEIN